MQRLAGIFLGMCALFAGFNQAVAQEGTTYVIFSPLKSAAEIDHEFTQDKDFVAAMGEDGMKKLAELEASALMPGQTNLFAFSPSMSYASDEWIKSDPGFWKPKMPTPAVATKKPAN